MLKKSYYKNDSLPCRLILHHLKCNPTDSPYYWLRYHLQRCYLREQSRQLQLENMPNNDFSRRNPIKRFVSSVILSNNQVLKTICMQAEQNRILCLKRGYPILWNLVYLLVNVLENIGTENGMEGFNPLLWQKNEGEVEILILANFERTESALITYLYNKIISQNGWKKYVALNRTLNPLSSKEIRKFTSQKEGPPRIGIDIFGIRMTIKVELKVLIQESPPLLKYMEANPVFYFLTDCLIHWVQTNHVRLEKFELLPPETCRLMVLQYLESRNNQILVKFCPYEEAVLDLFAYYSIWDNLAKIHAYAVMHYGKEANALCLIQRVLHGQMAHATFTMRYLKLWRLIIKTFLLLKEDNFEKAFSALE